MTDVLEPVARAAADSILDRESDERDHLVVALSGAHAYGFPSPDSDLDVKAVHIAPSEHFFGLTKPEREASFIELVGEVEVDYTSNELGGVVRGLLDGNGNYLERVLGVHQLRRDPLCDELAELARGALSRRYLRHYRGFALNQLNRVQRSERPAAKQVLYVLRTALTGTHLLKTGELVADVTLLLDDYGYGDARELVEAKRQGERMLLEPHVKGAWLDRLDAAIAGLDEVESSSPLPPEADETPLDDWLVRTRRARLG